MTADTDIAKAEVLATYRARRLALIEEAREDERQRHPIHAAHKRHAARMLTIHMLAEDLDPEPVER